MSCFCWFRHFLVRKIRWLLMIFKVKISAAVFFSWFLFYLYLNRVFMTWFRIVHQLSVIGYFWMGSVILGFLLKELAPIDDTCVIFRFFGKFLNKLLKWKNWIVWYISSKRGSLICRGTIRWQGCHPKVFICHL